jgi:hypothetical protein
VRTDRLCQADHDAAGKRPPQAAEAANDDGLEGVEQTGRTDAGIEIGARTEKKPGDSAYGKRGAQASGNADRFKGFAEDCMAEYDLDGWKVQDLTDPGELGYHVLRGAGK